MLFLLFLTIPLVFSADPKCPEGFTYFKRTPTAKNNHTKEWCLGFFQHPSCGNRNVARSVCKHYNSSISLPENMNEFNVLSKIAEKNKIPNGHAIDGSISPRCMKYVDKIYKAKGDCVQSKRYLFEDDNTDPTYILSLSLDFVNYVANQYNKTTPEIFAYSDCLQMEHTSVHSPNVALAYCHGTIWYNEEATTDSNSVLCGRRPL